MPDLVRCACDALDQGAWKSLELVHRTMPTRTAVATTRTQCTVSSFPVMSQVSLTKAGIRSAQTLSR